METAMDHAPQIISYGLVIAFTGIIAFAMLYTYLS
jgi:hypothetical protein